MSRFVIEVVSDIRAGRETWRVHRALPAGGDRQLRSGSGLTRAALAAGVARIRSR